VTASMQSETHDVPSMVDVKRAIDARRRQLEMHPFLRGLEASTHVDQVRAFVPQLYFYVFAFQDMLRLTHVTIADPRLREIAARHRAEDAGHEIWFASDVAELGCERDVRWVFGAQHRVTRDVCYALIAELLETQDDRVRMVFPLVLEAAGSTFFGRVIDVLSRARYTGELRYFARSHQDVEAAHDMLSSEGERALDEVTLDADSLRDALALVGRMFDQLERLAAHLEQYRSGELRALPSLDD
jgi:hypothetical protein